jgi:DNA-binding XRE family transcriptional regulator
MTAGCKIYGLRKISTGQYLYVGATMQPPKFRFKHHASSNKQLRADFESKDIAMDILEVIDHYDINKEREWVHRLNNEGHPVTNKRLTTECTVLNSLNMAKVLRESRCANQLTQGEAASYIGIKRATYAAYEEGRAEPPVKVLYKLRDFYGYDTIEDFIECSAEESVQTKN